MNGWNNLVAPLDAMFCFPNKVASKAKKLFQGLDYRTQEQ